MSSWTPRGSGRPAEAPVDEGTRYPLTTGTTPSAARSLDSPSSGPWRKPYSRTDRLQMWTSSESSILGTCGVGHTRSRRLSPVGLLAPVSCRLPPASCRAPAATNTRTRAVSAPLDHHSQNHEPTARGSRLAGPIRMRIHSRVIGHDGSTSYCDACAPRRRNLPPSPS